jgi:uncharacterized protein (DUF1778 family)
LTIKKKNRNRQITIAVSDGEWDAYTRAAIKMDQSLSGFVRLAALLRANDVNAAAAPNAPLDGASKSP